MLNNYRNSVKIVVDKNYFDNCFEPKRRSLQKKLGLSNLSQKKFTAYLHAKESKIKLNKFSPKLKRYGSFI